MIRKDNMPLVVHAALLGIRNRRTAVIFVWACLALAAAALLGTVAMVIRSDWTMSLFPFLVSFAFLGCAWWYWYAIRWVDQHSSWVQA
jgi:hypothetical protein